MHWVSAENDKGVVEPSRDYDNFVPNLREALAGDEGRSPEDRINRTLAEGTVRHYKKRRLLL